MVETSRVTAHQQTRAVKESATPYTNQVKSSCATLRVAWHFLRRVVSECIAMPKYTTLEKMTLVIEIGQIFIAVVEKLR